MKCWHSRFNLNLWMAALAVILTACASRHGDPKKEAKTYSTLRLSLEAPGPANLFSGAVKVAGVYVNMAKEPFLTELDVVKAEIVEGPSGYAIQIHFNSHGTLLLEMTTTANRGRRIGVMSQFPEERWLAAPAIKGRISNGVFTFTPDATRDEAERLVKGLTALIAKAGDNKDF